MDADLKAEIRSWIWHEREDGWLEHCVQSDAGTAGQAYNGLVVAPDFRVVYSLFYGEQDRRTEVSCRLHRSDGTELGLAISNARGGYLSSWHARRDGDKAFEPQPELVHATDLDLSWTPLTNTFAIWRLRLEVGESQEIGVAWVQLPDLRVEAVPQRYTRLAERVYRFEGASGFVADLELDERDMVERYGTLWERRDVMEPQLLLD